jgi:hypothetical protein
MCSFLNIPQNADFRSLLSASLTTPNLSELKLPTFHNIEKLAAVREDSQQTQELLNNILGLHQGRPVILGDFPNGLYHRLLLITHSNAGLNAKSEDRGFIAISETLENGQKINSIFDPCLELVYFPSPSDLRAYFLAGAHSRKLGPADLFPGSVGILKFDYNLKESSAQIRTLQSSVKHIDSNTKRILERGNLKSKYFTWKNQLLDLTFDFASRIGLSRIEFGVEAKTYFPIPIKDRNNDCIRERALYHNFRIEGDYSIILT